jgi:hypothetical protein
MLELNFFLIFFEFEVEGEGENLMIVNFVTQECIHFKGINFLDLVDFNFFPDFG